MTIKKSITINLAQTLITIDEDAYEALQKYLHEVERFFIQTEDSSEIISDIEARIAEVLKEKTTNSHPSISIDDVNDVIAAMGTPDDFAGTTDNEASSSHSSNESHTKSEKNTPRRLFRDADNAVIAGVCSGIGNYFGTDPVFIRILFVFLFFASGGTALFLYILLWIAIPPATTVSEKMEMNGEPVTLESLKNRAQQFATQEQIAQAQKNIERGARQFATEAQHIGRRLGSKIEYWATHSGRVILRILGIIMSVLGIIFLSCLIWLILIAIRPDITHVQINDVETRLELE